MTVMDVARLSGECMLTTERLGHEDGEGMMEPMRPTLARINTLGFVTTNSQIGTKTPGHWQRAYLCGFADKRVATKLFNDLDRQDGVFILISTPGKMGYGEYGVATRLSLTLREKNLTPKTSIPLDGAQSFEDHWMGLLEETGLRGDLAAMEQVEKSARDVVIVDMNWGRKTWLFDEVLACLENTASRKTQRKE